MVFNHICNRLRTLFLTFLNIFRRALCCLTKRRRTSSDSECEQLNTINVVPNTGKLNKTSDNDRDWNSWDDAPRTIEEHIEVYRQKLVETNESNECEPDYFQDMTPQITKQKKILLQDNNQKNPDFSRLKAEIDIPTATELEDWEDEDGNKIGWDELDNEKTKQLIREKRKELRVQRQHKNKLINS